MSATPQQPAQPSRIGRREFLSRSAMVGAIGAAAVATPTVITGCGSSSKSSSASGPMSFWNFYAPQSGSNANAQTKWFTDVAAAWNKKDAKHPVKLNYIPVADYVNGSKLQTAFASGTGPDIFLLSPGDFLRYYNGGVLEELTPYMKKEAVDDFFPNVMGTRLVDGKVYALPMEVEPMAFYYSQKAFEDAHLSEADVPKTWNELLDVAAKLKKGRRFGLIFETAPGYYQNFTWYPFMWEGGGEAVAKDQKSSAFDSKATVAALTLWQDSIKRGLAPRKLLGTGGNDVVANLVSGYGAIMNCGIWGVSALVANPKFKFGVFTLPAPAGGTPRSVAGGWAFVVNKKGKNPEQAAKFVTWALGSMQQDSVQRMVDWCIKAKSDVAPRKSALDAATKAGGYSTGPMKYFKDSVFPAARGEPRYPAQVYNAISQAIQSAQLTGKSPGSASSSAANAIDSYLKSYNGAAIL